MSLTGPFGAQVENLSTLIANVSAWRTFTDTESVAAAKARVHLLYALADSETWPLAIVKIGAWNAERDAAGAAIEAFAVSSSLALLFEDKKSLTAANVESFVNSVGSIVDGMLDLSSSSGYLLIKSIQGVDDTFFFDDEREDGETIMRAVFQIDWGT